MRGRFPEQRVDEHLSGFVEARPTRNRFVQITERADVDEGRFAGFPGSMLDPSIVGGEQEHCAQRKTAQKTRPRSPGRAKANLNGV